MTLNHFNMTVTFFMTHSAHYLFISWTLDFEVSLFIHLLGQSLQLIVAKISQTRQNGRNLAEPNFSFYDVIDVILNQFYDITQIIWTNHIGKKKLSVNSMDNTDSVKVGEKKKFDQSSKNGGKKVETDSWRNSST